MKPKPKEQTLWKLSKTKLNRKQIPSGKCNTITLNVLIRMFCKFVVNGSRAESLLERSHIQQRIQDTRLTRANKSKSCQKKAGTAGGLGAECLDLIGARCS